MTFIAFQRPMSVLSVLGESAQRIRERHTLTPQERHNMSLSRDRVAVHTASLGGHPFHH
ncbi:MULTISPECIES: hypothetical protein [unclassified Nocardia]|uniref:hypothetical protein n=1 Tax=unclassified Nocardia TaxID=2637762 RepID=UPI0035D77EEC